MNDVILEVHNVTKVYKMYASPWQQIARWFGYTPNSMHLSTILQDISFSAKRGETIGIVGHNGAGKSTLLKIIAGTLKLTSGRIVKQGSVVAILELGMGFHPDLTGRQNVYHTAGLMGFSKKEIDNVMDDIEAFAEIGEAFDEPVRIYSSGMQVRVAFAIATAYRPDILIVDEALSVGDAYFQHKSFAKIKTFQEEGTTMLLVSHDKNAIVSICDRAILFEKGKIVQDGDAESVMDLYNALIAKQEDTKLKQVLLKNGKKQTVSGNGLAHVASIELFDAQNNPTDTVAVGDQVTLKIKVDVHKDLPSLVLGYSIKDRLGQVVFGTNTWHTKQVIYDPKQGTHFEFDISFEVIFGVGNYSVQVALVENDTHLQNNYEWIDLALIFEVINVRQQFFVGMVWSQPKIRIKNI
ncbi:ABC transporter ATP-binding protein [Sulfurimonas hydrogeniphila]|uniref:ABC transporter ATP-binding protein n=1 Tax=Sulfurimonas TaxID=202746 RepID=UPI00125EC765|nr:ABC transporter ATP-binding protein [Sulfurimonas hydrogeniphila]